MLNGRKRIITVISGLALAAAVGVGPSSPALAAPDIKDVQARVDTLYHQAEQASERYNDAKVQLSGLRQDLVSLRADEKRQETKLSGARNQVRDSVVRQYEGQSISAVSQVVVSGDSSAFLSGMSTMTTYDDLQSQLFDDYSTELKALDIRREATQKRTAEVADTTAQLADEKSTIDDKLGQAQDLLGRLKADERQALLDAQAAADAAAAARVPAAASAPAAPAAVPAAPATAPAPAPAAPAPAAPAPAAAAPSSGRAAAAVSYAMAQVGNAYVYGAAGPSAFDCSGLMMMAWAQAGVSLPHSSTMQYSSGQRIAASDLQPGDLVFYYSPVSHVDMYIGNGMIVGAQNPSAGVQVTSLYSMPYVGAVRPG